MSTSDSRILCSLILLYSKLKIEILIKYIVGGDKIKVGSSIQLSQGENPNLLNGLYSIQSYEYEGEIYTYNQLKELIITITKSGIQLSCNKTYLLDDNEPKCILSPRLFTYSKF